MLSVVILILLFTAIGSSYLGVFIWTSFLRMQVWLLYELRRRKIDATFRFLDVLTVTIRSGMPFRARSNVYANTTTVPF